jgi:hypothetical protein
MVDNAVLDSKQLERLTRKIAERATADRKISDKKDHDKKEKEL